jgi:hypothetical protein
MLLPHIEQQWRDFDIQFDNKLKIGFDVHGVLDTHFNKYTQLISCFDRSKIEIHIVTGIKEHLGLQDNPELKDLQYDKWFSIHEYCEKLGVDIKFDNKNRPLIDPSIWDVQKAEYCKREGIMFLFDDSPHYGKHMHESIVYLQQHNNNKDNWRYNIN